MRDIGARPSSHQHKNDVAAGILRQRDQIFGTDPLPRHLRAQPAWRGSGSMKPRSSTGPCGTRP